MPAATPAVAPVQPTQAMVEPMAKLSYMRGVWRGPATGSNPDGSHSAGEDVRDEPRARRGYRLAARHADLAALTQRASTVAWIAARTTAA